MKGAGNLLDGLYSDVGERIMNDIDFLVPEKDFLLAAQMLKNAGYSSDYPAYWNVESLVHYPGLFKANVPAGDEIIHRIPVGHAYQSWFNPEIIEKGKKQYQHLTDATSFPIGTI